MSFKNNCPELNSAIRDALTLCMKIDVRGSNIYSIVCSEAFASQEQFGVDTQCFALNKAYSCDNAEIINIQKDIMRDPLGSRTRHKDKEHKYLYCLASVVHGNVPEFVVETLLRHSLLSEKNFSPSRYFMLKILADRGIQKDFLEYYNFNHSRDDHDITTLGYLFKLLLNSGAYRSTELIGMGEIFFKYYSNILKNYNSMIKKLPDNESEFINIMEYKHNITKFLIQFYTYNGNHFTADAVRLAAIDCEKINDHSINKRIVLYFVQNVLNEIILSFENPVIWDNFIQKAQEATILFDQIPDDLKHTFPQKSLEIQMLIGETKLKAKLIQNINISKEDVLRCYNKSKEFLPSVKGHVERDEWEEKINFNIGVVHYYYDGRSEAIKIFKELIDNSQNKSMQDMAILFSCHAQISMAQRTDSSKNISDNYVEKCNSEGLKSVIKILTKKTNFNAAGKIIIQLENLKLSAKGAVFRGESSDYYKKIKGVYCCEQDYNIPTKIFRELPEINQMKNITHKSLEDAEVNHYGDNCRNNFKVLTRIKHNEEKSLLNSDRCGAVNLIDFTHSPHAALYFACCSARNLHKDGYIFIAPVGNFDKHCEKRDRQPEKDYLVEPEYINDTIEAKRSINQKSLFIRTVSGVINIKNHGISVLQISSHDKFFINLLFNGIFNIEKHAYFNSPDSENVKNDLDRAALAIKKYLTNLGLSR